MQDLHEIVRAGQLDQAVEWRADDQQYVFLDRADRVTYAALRSGDPSQHPAPYINDALFGAAGPPRSPARASGSEPESDAGPGRARAQDCWTETRVHAGGPGAERLCHGTMPALELARPGQAGALVCVVLPSLWLGLGQSAGGNVPHPSRACPRPRVPPASAAGGGTGPLAASAAWRASSLEAVAALVMRHRPCARLTEGFARRGTGHGRVPLAARAVDDARAPRRGAGLSGRARRRWP